MKQILLINDVVGCSHVGMVAMLPILTHQGHAVYNLPTALVSNTLDYGRFNIMETTSYMRGTLPVWQQLGFRFDAVCTGLMFSEEQARLVQDYCRRLRDGGTAVYVDPIMGDAGRLYNGISQRQVELMRQMVAVADLTFPNLTEACLLTGMPYNPGGMTWDDACRMLDALLALGCRSALVTSARVDGQPCVLGASSELKIQNSKFKTQNSEFKIQNSKFKIQNSKFKIPYTEIPAAIHGTGDIFSALLVGHLQNGLPLQQSTARAMEVVSRLIDRNRHLPDPCRGIPVEQCLDLL